MGHGYWGAIGNENICLAIARSRRLLYWKARGATEIVIGRCELLWKVVKAPTLNVSEGQ